MKVKTATKQYKPRAVVPDELVELVVRRKAAGITPGAIARALGVARWAVRAWELGVNEVKAYQITAYRDALVVLERVGAGSAKHAVVGDGDVRTEKHHEHGESERGE